jgi:hypothetical protein
VSHRHPAFSLFFWRRDERGRYWSLNSGCCTAGFCCYSSSQWSGKCSLEIMLFARYAIISVLGSGRILTSRPVWAI